MDWFWVELNCLVSDCVCVFWLCMVVCGMALGGIKLSGWWLCVFFGCVWLCVEWCWVELNCLVGGCVCLFLLVYDCVWNGFGWDSIV